MGTELLSIKDLYVSYYSYRVIDHALSGIHLDIFHAETIGLVGETGCGKSTVGLAIVRLIPFPGKIDKGQILFEGEDLLKKSDEEMREIRREKVSMIFQDPTASLNPVFRVGDQIAEAIAITKGKKLSDVMDEAVDMLSLVGIPNPLKVARQYPHELSGGMKQRVMIAIALSTTPKLLIADEPTSNLDVTIQAQILDLMLDLQKRIGMSVLLITHDMGVVAQTCDRVAVMYAGNVIEIGKVIDVFRDPEHPYTRGLLETVTLGEEKRRLKAIPGTVPDLINIPKGCSFQERCLLSKDRCIQEKPRLKELASGHFVACHMA